jgi:hypothetical protein
MLMARGWGLDVVVRGAVGGDDEKGQEYIGRKGDDGINQKSKSANASGFFPLFLNFIRREVAVGSEIRIDVELANVSGHVEKETEPSHPGEELGFANLADLRR